MTTRSPEVVRPRMRTDMAFLQTRDGLYVHGHGDAFLIKGAAAYRYLSALLPHLDGSTTLDDLVAGLPEAHASSVRSLIATLASRGVVFNAPDTRAVVDPEIRSRFAGQLALLEQHGDDGSGFLRAAQARVLVLGDEPEPAGAVDGSGPAAELAAALSANGVGSASGGLVRVETVAGLPDLTGFDLVCLVAADRPSPALFALADRARAAGAAFVSLSRIGDDLVLGPWQHGDRDGGCVYSAMLRMSDNAIPGVERVWQAAAAGVPAPAPATALPAAAVSIAVSMLGFEVFKVLTGRIPGDIEDQVVIIDPDRLTARIERVVRHPASPRGAAAPAPGEPDADVSEVERAYQRFRPVIADTVGLMRRFEDDDLSQIPVKVSAVIAPSADAAPIVAFGSGTLLEARVAVLEEAATRYAVNTHRRCPGLLAPAPPDAETVQAERITTWLGAAGPLAAEPLVAATDLADGRPLAIPRGAVLAGPWDRKAARFEPVLLGVVAAPTREEAVSRALIQAAGAYTVAAVAREELHLSPVETLPDPGDGAHEAESQQLRRLSMLVNEARMAGLALTLHLAPGVVPVAVVRVRDGAAEELVARPGRSWLDAAESALLAIVGARQLGRSPHRWPKVCLPAAPTLTRAAVAVPQPARPATAALSETVEQGTVIARLSAAGLRAGTVDLTPPDLAGVTNIVRILLFRAAGPSH